MRPSGPPTDEIPVWTSPDGVDRKTAQAVIDLAMRAGVAMLATGAAAADVSATKERRRTDKPLIYHPLSKGLTEVTMLVIAVADGSRKFLAEFRAEPD